MSKRTAIEGGGFFVKSAAKKWAEDSNFDGKNFISAATNSQWEHEALYRSRKGSWILHEWSQWQGTTATYRYISSDSAAQWLIRQGYDPAEAGLLAVVESLEV